ncbi:penicillin-binding protein 2 [Candidatus Legionella polyplacis]|uniref:penicillin-binding protein 2 n=1 Tax=Candidatus Legionella polyplacis TaxID=2005262 RepID=UPI000C1F0B3D|nr:penicillin-binding protein 2 [Candidatus Legionella polyplacis]ATW02057.1 penicillin-binding protein 2 [Candidatus Legionella polyplacis]
MKNLQINPKIKKSYFYIIEICIITFLIISFLRLFYLQIYQHSYFNNLSLKNHTIKLPIFPNRGMILDRSGKILAENIPIYNLEINFNHIKNINKFFKKIKKILPFIKSTTLKKLLLLKHKKYHSKSLILKKKLNNNEIAIFLQNQYQLPNIYIKIKFIRYYPLKEATAHILGYIGYTNTNKSKKLKTTNHKNITLIGKSGIEKFYENRLHGKSGYKEFEINSKRKIVKLLKIKNPIPGETLYLTIDSYLQKIAYQIMKKQQGSIIIMKPYNGEILAMISSPSFNPNFIINKTIQNKYKKFLLKQNSSFYNRAIQGIYSPASTIKPFIAIAGLEKGIIHPNKTIYDPGWFRITGTKHIYHDWKKNGHGKVNLYKAITVSCDTYFYQLGYKLGISYIEKILKKFGFGQKTHIDLNNESTGLIPNKQWKKRNKKTSWYLGDTIITSIGQGFLLTSPLQLTNATAIICQNGKKFKPHLLMKSINYNHKIFYFHKTEETYLHLKSNKYWKIIIESMKSVITDREGTGYNNFGKYNNKFTISAKTGTAQIYTKYISKKNKKLKINSLFIGFAPIKNPAIIITVIIENNHNATFIAYKILNNYFNHYKNNLNSHEFFFKKNI